jgi:predicted ArsR family transcriptional regulator
MRNDFIAALLTRHADVGPAVWAALWLRENLQAGQPIAVTKMAKQLNITPRRMTAHLSRLAAAGLIQRDVVEAGRPSTYKILVAENHE